MAPTAEEGGQVGFLRHNDSLLNLSSFLEEHHGNHNVALDELMNDQISVGDSAEVAVGDNEEIPEEKEEKEDTSQVQEEKIDKHPTGLQDEYYRWYSFDPYAPMDVVKPASSNLLLTCLFPWVRRVDSDHSHDDEEPEGKAVALGEVPAGSDPPLNAADTIINDQQESDDGQEEEGSDKPSPTSPTLKGILKKQQNNRISREQVASKGNNNRRALFNTIYEAKKVDNDHSKKVEFHPMAGVVVVESHKNMTPVEKIHTWWTKNDYNDFKKTNRFVTRAMLQKGSEVWLMTNPSWDHEEKEEDDKNSDKWWCRFGHSRRGLEHITSPEEGKERHRNAYQSIAAVINEQERQRRFKVARDEERIRTTYLRYNFWARELCLAAGASDAEAVRSNFRRGRCRDYYLSERNKRVVSSGPAEQNIPEFMKRKQHKQTTVRLSAQIQLQPATEEAIHDPPLLRKESLSKKAVGFGSEEHVNVAAALSGTGPITSQLRTSL